MSASETTHDCGCVPRATELNGTVRQRTAERNAEASLMAFARFATGVVHEVNNPLGIALSSAQTALRHLPSSAPPQHVRCLERVVESVRAASNAIRDMLQVGSYCGPGGGAQSFDVRDVLRFATTAMQGLADERRCVVKWDVTPESSRMVGNPLAIEIAVASLVYRAIESGASKVTLSSQTRGQWLEVVIADDVIDRRISVSEVTGHDLIEQVVREHDGDFNVQPTDDGTKSILRFRFARPEECNHESH